MISLLYVQRPEILEIHRPEVEAFVKAKFPEVSLSFSDGTPQRDEKTADWIVAPAAAWVEAVLQRAVNASWVHFQGAGTDQLDAFIASRPDLRFTASRGVNADAIAEYVVGALLYFAKDFDFLLASQAGRRWERRWLKELSRSTVVIFGTGQIGQATARRLRSFDVRVVGISRSGRPADGFDSTHQADRLDEILPQADAFVIAAPLTEDTAGAIGATQLRRLPRHSVIVNVARGGIVDEVALQEHLSADRLRGAVVDVFEEEPLSPSSRLWETSRLVITPHVAGTTQFYLARMLEAFAAEAPVDENPSPNGVA